MIVDEKGVRHTHCHGVTGSEWYRTLIAAIKQLTTPERRTRMGVMRVAPSEIHLCDDPDCTRLNRTYKPCLAKYMITKDLAPVRPANPDDFINQRICEGHPRSPGQYLCEKCARVATAKRLIDVEREARQ
jgi:hypothetical protein